MGGTDLRDDELIATLTALAGYYLTRADLRRTGQFVAAVVGVVVVCGCLQGKGLLGWLLFGLVLSRDKLAMSRGSCRVGMAKSEDIWRGVG